MPPSARNTPLLSTLAQGPWAKPRLSLITTFGLGYCRPFPGTWGSAPVPVLAAVLIALGLGPVQQPWIYSLVMLAVIILFGYACIRDGSAAEARFGGKDPSEVVADETAGQALAMLTLPAAAMANPGLAMFTVFFAFIAFRVFDILKPWPVFQLQDRPAGWGILLDDLMAGLYALGLLHLVAWLALSR